MSRRRSKKKKEQVIQYAINNISQEKMIEIQAEAYYRALKRIEVEKSEKDEQKPKEKEYKWYEKVLFVLNVFFCPWKIHKKFSISNQIYDSILVLFVSLVLKIGGSFMWLFGILEIKNEICHMYTVGITEEIIKRSLVVIFFWLLGSVFVLSGEEFSKETDSNKIYAYSACIIALISCLAAIIH